ncbi:MULTISPECIES: type II toxin-antitoxin system VapC family toxin [Rhizobium]|uniref:Ribonuclease VapC n=1 Tax=Rhizobium rhododendri TaxID=2506430 RepID=A0ABY8ISF0_9HYPH|nr:MULTISPECIES: type II toxin-antitoxin system VapC family toxin [Rhizobium]TQX86024.1 type II toxin-antitoxin system VapC family toxin [Rhizobium sp. rho-13.1]TQY10988.1 type II toxin-antitoxin system VapC family toxin [Rhizobium sp. rho-1.1]WFS25819.1 type II toxin-antitoxin system VapC family toxin [Rhizobium rhododendri]
MILLDTNVISEPLKSQPDPRVAAWIDTQAVETLYVAAISLAELRYGIAVHPDGKKKQAAQEKLDRLMLPLFRGRIMPFDEAAAQAYAELRAAAAKKGKAIGDSDGYIAATAKANGLMIATRDTSPFEAAGLTVINPWEASNG